MELKIFVNNPWQQNTVLLYDHTGEAVVIDCGCFSKAERIELKEFVDRKKLKLVALLCTHLHFDHILGNRFMQEEYGLSAQAAEADVFLLEGVVQYATALGLRGMEEPPALGGFLKDGDVVKFGISELKVIAVSGHSPGGLCFYSADDRLLIAGDVLFEGSIGRTDLPGGNHKELIQGIKNKLFILPDDVQIIPGHGPATVIGEEKRENPFFK